MDAGSSVADLSPGGEHANVFKTEAAVVADLCPVNLLDFSSMKKQHRKEAHSLWRTYTLRAVKVKGQRDVLLPILIVVLHVNTSQWTAERVNSL